MKNPNVTISGWSVLAGTLLLAFTSFYLAGIYGTVHWGVGQNAAGVEVGFQGLMRVLGYQEMLDSHESAPKVVEMLEEYIRNLRRASSDALSSLEAFRLYAIAAFVLSLFSLVGKPRWLAFFAIPIGLLAAAQVRIIM